MSDVARGARSGVTLGDVVREIPGAKLEDEGARDVVVRGVRHDSRKIEAGDMFVARAGLTTDGSKFIGDAIARGAAAIVHGRSSKLDPCGVARVEVSDVPAALAFASAAVYGHPTFALEVVGVTGTNGKTTTAHLVQAAIDGSGGRCGIVGTLGYRFEDLDLTATHTSPEADELARIARAMKDKGATHLAMEVSSIALAAKRVEAVRFRVAAFTNLTQDHLDYHGSMEAYAAAKLRLFTDLGPGASAINVDDDFGKEIAKRVAKTGNVARFSIDPESSAEIAPIDLAQTKEGIAMRARTPRGDVFVRSPLVGAHNVSNLLTAIAVAHLLDLYVERVGEALSKNVRVAGRLERCDDPARDDVVVLVDYAHTPDALARVLDSVRAFGREIVCVFGCGGDRDPTKRPLMGEAVAKRASFAIVTNDNPRSEDPKAIADAIVPGMQGASFVVELDRRTAIQRAIVEAKPASVIVIAGKGHEPYQILGDTTLAFSDVEEAKRALATRRGEQR